MVREISLKRRNDKQGSYFAIIPKRPKKMKLEIESYITQKQRWPTEGHHILAQYDDESIIVYQAYRSSIGLFAVDNGYFGGDFSYSRMSWIKPNFLWMRYRSGWGKKPGQEIILAVKLKRPFFDLVLSQAVPSSYQRKLYSTQAQWKKALNASSVRLQWDPDHNPSGQKVPRRAIQLGLRDSVLKAYSKSAIIDIYDISDFVGEQHKNLQPDYSNLETPKEEIYLPRLELPTQLGLSLPV